MGDLEITDALIMARYEALRERRILERVLVEIETYLAAEQRYKIDRILKLLENRRNI